MIYLLYLLKYIDMIFISAQPDTTYFIWQVELQLFNLLQKCWPADKIHVLFAYSEENGINPEALRLQDKFPDSPIYFYADTRLNKEYSVTVRPHILEKHLTCFPKLRTEALFHLDSDVIFREIPDFSILEFDDNWYASDTRSYMSCDLLIDYFGYDVFKNMCGIINVLPEEVIKYRSNTGGAQYIIKNTPVGFWSKVESDCNKLYDYLYEVLFINTNHDFFKSYPISIWLTEMWVVYWNTILYDKPFHIHPLLDFCWAHQNRAQWKKTYMLHYTGGLSGNFLKKIDYTYAPPFYDDLSYISEDSSTIGLRVLIEKYRTQLYKKRLTLLDVTFIIYVTDLKCFVNLDYLLKFIDSHFVIVGDTSSIESLKSTYGKCHNLKFVQVESVNRNNLKVILRDVNIVNTNYVCIVSSNCIMPIQQILKSIELLNMAFKIVVPYDGCYQIDVLTMFLFRKILDDNFLLSNIGKLNPVKHKEICLFLNRKKNIPNKKQKVTTVKGSLFVKR